MRARLLPLLLLLLASSGQSAVAQDTPAVFVHGLKADESTWRNTASRLRQRLAIEPFVAHLDWPETFESQADDLARNLPALPPSTVAVGHSNGGMVSRQWARSRPLGGLVTVGTPHWGAPLVANLLDLVGFNQRLYSWAGLALGAAGAGGFDYVLVYVQSALMLARDIGLHTLGGLALLGLDSGAPVLYQMIPNSSYLTDINSADNLAREAWTIRSKVGLTYVARNYWLMGPARAIAPDRADALYAETWAAIFSIELAAHYLGTMSSNPTALFISNSLLTVSSALRQIDPVWCWAVTYDRTCATPHDGIVPQPHQSFPGAYNVVLSGPAHIQEAGQSDEALYQAFTQRLGVATRGSAPPPPPQDGGTHALGVDEALSPGARLVSMNGQYHLEFQWDGNVVLYRMADGLPLWATHTGAAPGSFVMQGDGHLVLYDQGGTPVWYSGTAGYPGARLELQDDGNLVIYSYHGAPLWASGTAQ
jgi:pimeloyl-ACP methyl ester carboxylesterase